MLVEAAGFVWVTEAFTGALVDIPVSTDDETAFEPSLNCSNAACAAARARLDTLIHCVSH